MKLKSLLLTSLIVLIASAGFAQRLRVTSGDLNFLQGQKKINVVYSYENMGVGKYSDEKDYIEERVAKLNEKEPGKGDEWKENWLADRENRYKPKFEELINNELQRPGVLVGNYPDAEYTIVLKTLFTEPGFNVGVMRKNAYIDLDAVFVKTGTTEEVATINILNSPGRGGMGFDFDTGYRIQEAYAKAGKELGNYLRKKAF